MIVYIVRVLAADEGFDGKHRDMLTQKPFVRPVWEQNAMAGIFA